MVVPLRVKFAKDTLAKYAQINHLEGADSWTLTGHLIADLLHLWDQEAPQDIATAELLEFAMMIQSIDNKRTPEGPRDWSPRRAPRATFPDFLKRGPHRLEQEG